MEKEGFSNISEKSSTESFEKEREPIEIVFEESPEKAIEKAGHYVNESLEDFKGSPVLLLLSGGSSLKMLEYIDLSLFGPDITIGALDDRYSRDPKINNFAQIVDSNFFRGARERSASYIDTRPGEDESLENLADRFENELHNWISENPEGKILATIGMGADGHVAGIMPDPAEKDRFSEIFESDRWVAGYDAKEKDPKNPLRVTTTLSFIKKIDRSITFMTGEEKRSALEAALDSGSFDEIPARVIQEISKASIITDIFIER